MRGEGERAKDLATALCDRRVDVGSGVSFGDVRDGVESERARRSIHGFDGERRENGGVFSRGPFVGRSIGGVDRGSSDEEG